MGRRGGNCERCDRPIPSSRRDAQPVGRLAATGLYNDLQRGRLWRVPRVTRNHLDGGASRASARSIPAGVTLMGERISPLVAKTAEMVTEHLDDAGTVANSPAAGAELQHIAHADRKATGKLRRVLQLICRPMLVGANRSRAEAVTRLLVHVHRYIGLSASSMAWPAPGRG